jgi:hypothetical protein
MDTARGGMVLQSFRVVELPCGDQVVQRRASDGTGPCWPGSFAFPDLIHQGFRGELLPPPSVANGKSRPVPRPPPAARPSRIRGGRRDPWPAAGENKKISRFSRTCGSGGRPDCRRPAVVSQWGSSLQISGVSSQLFCVRRMGREHGRIGRQAATARAIAPKVEVGGVPGRVAVSGLVGIPVRRERRDRPVLQFRPCHDVAVRAGSHGPGQLGKSPCSRGPWRRTGDDSRLRGDGRGTLH